QPLSDMATTNGSEQNDRGPYLAAAFFCEDFIEDKKGSLSIVRITDQIDLHVDQAIHPDFPSETNRIQLPIHALISFKTGLSPGEHTITCVMHSPSGKTKEVFRRIVSFSDAQHGGANLRLTLNLGVYKGGLFWLFVYLDGKHMTRMPINIT